jgi:glutathione peroxidase
MRLFLTTLLLSVSLNALATCPQALDYQTRALHSNDSLDLCQLADDKVVLVVNTASQCGFTPQFGQLETLYQRYRDQGLLVVGFPSNDFRQEYGDEGKAAKVCFVNYGVTFPMLAPSHVTGEQANPVFQALARTTAAPNWNFNKYLLDRDGTVLGHWRASTPPLDSDLERNIQQAVAR